MYVGEELNNIVVTLYCLVYRCDLRIISDANVFFIETVLKKYGILECFREIKTNPSYVDGEGRLRILPYHDFNSSSHGCHICPPNMCKVKIKLFLSVFIYFFCYSLLTVIKVAN